MVNIQKTHYFDTLDEAQEFRERFEMDLAGYHPIVSSPKLVEFNGAVKYVVHTDRMSSCD
jgi:hypothetical protein